MQNNHVKRDIAHFSLEMKLIVNESSIKYSIKYG